MGATGYGLGCAVMGAGICAIGIGDGTGIWAAGI